MQSRVVSIGLAAIPKRVSPIWARWASAVNPVGAGGSAIISGSPWLKRPCHRSSEIVEEAICVGVDGTMPQDESTRNSEKMLSAEDEYREYFKVHGPSPISEMEVAETRKPITRATDGSLKGDDGINYDVFGWKEEQIDSVEEALKRGEAIFRQRAEEGVPDWPQSKVLRR